MKKYKLLCKHCKCKFMEYHKAVPWATKSRLLKKINESFKDAMGVTINEAQCPECKKIGLELK